MAKRPNQHLTAEKAGRIFENALPAEWVREQVQRDYGIDYAIQVFAEGRSTGIRFLVQLKGTERLNSNNSGQPTFDLDAERFATYRDEERLPVFVILVDVINGKCYYKSIKTPSVRQPSLKNGKRNVV